MVKLRPTKRTLRRCVNSPEHDTEGVATVPRQYTKTPLAERFKTKYEHRDTGCWEWTAFRDKAGYGRIRDNDGRSGESAYAHRVAWEMNYGEIPDGFVVHHHCGNRACVNPEHLELMIESEHLAFHGMILKWARDWDQCRDCGTTEVAHNAHGYCKRCYKRRFRKSRRKAMVSS